MEPDRQPLDYATPSRPTVRLWRKVFASVLFSLGGAMLGLALFVSNSAARADTCLMGTALLMTGVIFRFPRLRIF